MHSDENNIAQLDNNDYHNLAHAISERSKHMTVENILNEQIAKNRALFNKYLADASIDQVFQRNKLQTMVFLNVCWELQMINADGFTINDIVNAYEGLFNYKPVFKAEFKDTSNNTISQYVRNVFFNNVLSAKATDSMHTLQSAIFNDDLSYNYGNSISLYTFENKKQRYFKLKDSVVHYLVMSYEAYVDDVAGVSMTKLLDTLRIDNAKPANTLSKIQAGTAQFNMIVQFLTKKQIALKHADRAHIKQAMKEANHEYERWNKNKQIIINTIEENKRKINANISNLQNFDALSQEEHTKDKIKLWRECLQAYDHFNNKYSQALREIIDNFKNINPFNEKNMSTFFSSFELRKLDDVLKSDSIDHLNKLCDLLSPVLFKNDKKVLNPEMLFTDFTKQVVRPVKDANAVTILSPEQQKALIIKKEQERKAKADFVLKFCTILCKHAYKQPVLISQIIKTDSEFKQLFTKNPSDSRAVLFMLAQHPSERLESDIAINEKMQGLNWQTVQHALWQIETQALALNFYNSQLMYKFENWEFTDLICYMQPLTMQGDKNE